MLITLADTLYITPPAANIHTPLFAQATGGFVESNIAPVYTTELPDTRF